MRQCPIAVRVLLAAALLLPLALAPLHAALEKTGSGTAFVVSPDGYLLTCHHVVEDADKVEVTIGEKTYAATVLGVDARNDVALLKVEAKGLTALPLGNSNVVAIGLEVRACGFPLTSVLGDGIKVTRGTIAGIGMDGARKDFQIDAAVNPGNSGGPLVNMRGEVVGVVYARLESAAVGFAVPINYAKELLRNEGVTANAVGARADLGGPALVARVMPGIALVTVYENGGGDSTVDVPDPPVPPRPPNSATVGRVIVSPIDGATMVFVPAGEFLMGSPEDEGDEDEHPLRTVYLDDYYIDRTEVTVAAYRRFCAATKRAMPPEPEWKWQDTHPIVNVSWSDASAYAAWAGKALPTEAQWEKAARGTDGQQYPWGDMWDGAKCSNSVGKNPKKTSPVGNFPAGASPYGALDMAGNVWEWCADWYEAGNYRTAPAHNPTGPATGRSRVLRGGSWGDITDRSLQTATRNVDYFPGDWDGSFGFRCAARPTDVAPPPNAPRGITVDNTVLVPLRHIAEWLGATVEFDVATNCITLRTPTTTIRLTLNSAKAIVDGTEHTLQAPAMLYDGTAYVPLRFVAEGLNAHVEWHAETQYATITHPTSGVRLAVMVQLSKLSPIDGATMVFVPAGEFLMGSPDGVGSNDEHPQRKVYLDAYYIDRTEVTVAQYRKFCEATKRAM
jgi:formylglycine-generating enzyme required for sulfatase activity